MKVVTLSAGALVLRAGVEELGPSVAEGICGCPRVGNAPQLDKPQTLRRIMEVHNVLRSDVHPKTLGWMKVPPLQHL